jgi:hypothetical protein
MNDRLEEINDFVDEYFANKQKNIILTEDKVEYEHRNELIRKLECEQRKEFIRSFDIDKMNNIEKLFKIDNNNHLLWFINKSKYFFYEIKHYNKDINSMHFITLSQLYISVIHILHKKLLKNFSIKYISYSNQYEHYMNRFSDKKQRMEIFLYMNSNNNKQLDVIKKNKPYTIVLDEIEEYKKSINEIKQEISNINSELNNLIDINDENHKIFNNIINIYQNKIELIYKFISKFNYPEMIIYNFIVEKMKTNINILNILTHFTLPVKRQESNHPLFADILVIIKLDDNYHFIVIEYDGPTHDDIEDFRFIDSVVFCDITKNKYCISNNISLIRLNYKINMNEHFNTINNLIDQILILKKPVYHSIPTDQHYEQLLINYYAKNI